MEYLISPVSNEMFTKGSKYTIVNKDLEAKTYTIVDDNGVYRIVVKNNCKLINNKSWNIKMK